MKPMQVVVCLNLRRQGGSDSTEWTEERVLALVPEGITPDDYPEFRGLMRALSRMQQMPKLLLCSVMCFL